MSEDQTKELKHWIDRWLTAYNHSRGYTEANYDFDLENELFGWSDKQKLDFLLELSKHNLVDDAVAFLGAGIAEDLLLKNPDVVQVLEAEMSSNKNLAEIIAYAWESDDMDDSARLLIRRAQ